MLEGLASALCEEVIPNATAEFQQVAEDGTTFRIYKLGSLEVRTIQEASKEEQVHQVFSSRAVSWNAQGNKTQVGPLKTVKTYIYSMT